MTTNSEPLQLIETELLTKTLSLIVIFFGCLGLSNFYLENYFWASFYTSSIPTAPLASIHFIIFGILFYLNSRLKFDKFFEKISRFFLVFISINSFIVFLSFFIDKLQFFENTLIGNIYRGHFNGLTIGRMSIIASLYFILTSFSFYFYIEGKHKKKLLIYSSYISFFNIFSSLVFTIFYLYNIPLYHFKFITPPSFPATLSFLFLNLILVNLLSSVEKTPLFFFSDKTSSYILRAFFPLIISILIIGNFISTFNYSIFYSYEQTFKIIVGLIFSLGVIYLTFRYTLQIGKEIDTNIEIIKFHKESLEYEKNKLLSIIQSIQEGVVVTDKNEQIILMNSSAENLTEFNLQEVLNNSIKSLYNYTNNTSHTILTTKSKKQIITLGKKGIIENKNKEIVGYVFTINDITENIKMDKEKEKNIRIQGLGLLASGIAHDFNNLLCGIFGHFELIREEAFENKKIQLYVDSAVKIFNRAKTLTSQILIFSRGTSSHKKNTHIELVLKDTAGRIFKENNIIYHFDFAPNLFTCFVDPLQLDQAIEQIYLNSKQAMPQGGDIFIEVANYLIHQDNNTDGLLAGKYVKITVNDSGNGIPSDLLEKCFDPFFTTKEQASGLGLTIAHTIIKKHDGIIKINPEYRGGTSITIILPAHNQSYFEEYKSQEIDYQGNGPILIMDDEDFIIKYLQTILKLLGHEVLYAYHGAEAISIFMKAKEQGIQLKAIILDLTIQNGIGGKETCEKIRSLDSRIPIIASSGYSEDPILSTPEKYGFNLALKKPYLKDELIKTLSKIFK